MAQKIRDLMTTDLVKLEKNRPVSEAARMMRERNVGDVLVMSDGKLAGIVTDRDIVVRCVAAQEDPTSMPIERVCSGELATLSPDDEADSAVKLMREKSIRRLPVVENGQPCGILSLGDLAMDRDARSALGQISSAAPNR